MLAASSVPQQPGLPSAFQIKLPSVTSFILDAEAVAWDREKKQIQPFQVLTTRKRKVAWASRLRPTALTPQPQAPGGPSPVPQAPGVLSPVPRGTASGRVHPSQPWQHGCLPQLLHSHPGVLSGMGEEPVPYTSVITKGLCQEPPSLHPRKPCYSYWPEFCAVTTVSS